MARRNSRDDDDWDDEDDDYEPRRGRRGEPARRGVSPALLAGLGVGVLAVVVLAVLLFTKRSTERDRAMAVEAESRALAERDRDMGLAARPPAVAGPPKRPNAGPPVVPPGENWKKVIGKWSRPIAGKDDTGYPHSFEFRADRTATMTRQNFDLMPQTNEATVEVRFDEGETIGMTLRVSMGTYSYTFQLKPDGTLGIQGAGDLVFTRVK